MKEVAEKVGVKLGDDIDKIEHNINLIKLVEKLELIYGLLIIKKRMRTEIINKMKVTVLIWWIQGSITLRTC